MIVSINYANESFKTAQRFNSKMAKKFGADKVIEYTPNDIDPDFRERNSEIWNAARGAGYWIWKPYIIAKTLEQLEEDDYLLYSDSGSCLVDKIDILINVMNEEKTDIMLFSLHSLEKHYSKRDAFILLDCDQQEYTDSVQRCATYVLLRKTDYSMKFVKEWLEYAQDERIITNNANVMGKDNYEGFVENRHDQTILSLLSKKWGIKSFRDPSQYGNDMKYDKEILARSTYGQVFDSHRNKIMPKTYFTYKYVPRKWFDKWIKIKSL